MFQHCLYSTLLFFVIPLVLLDRDLTSLVCDQAFVDLVSPALHKLLKRGLSLSWGPALFLHKGLHRSNDLLEGRYLGLQCLNLIASLGSLILFQWLCYLRAPLAEKDMSSRLLSNV